MDLRRGMKVKVEVGRKHSAACSVFMSAVRCDFSENPDLQEHAIVISREYLGATTVYKYFGLQVSSSSVCISLHREGWNEGKVLFAGYLICCFSYLCPHFFLYYKCKALF